MKFALLTTAIFASLGWSADFNWKVEQEDAVVQFIYQKGPSILFKLENDADSSDHQPLIHQFNDLAAMAEEYINANPMESAPFQYELSRLKARMSAVTGGLMVPRNEDSFTTAYIEDNHQTDEDVQEAILLSLNAWNKEKGDDQG